MINNYSCSLCKYFGQRGNAVYTESWLKEYYENFIYIL